MDALHAAGILSLEEHQQLHDSYVFQRKLIDALRMVRGHAKDLTVPAPDTEEFEFLSRRLGYRGNLKGLRDDLERYSRSVRGLGLLLDESSADATD
jgi:glutamate-ammonia-ligase adenylyltransferase